MKDRVTSSPCLLCQKMLDDACTGATDHSACQPWGGGEVRFIFGFGSNQYDKAIGATTYSAVICDECAGRYIPSMQETLYDLNGNIIK